MESKTVRLGTPVLDRGRSISTVRLRPPTGAEYFEIGDVRRVGVRPSDGVVIVMDNAGAIQRYLKCCLVSPSYEALEKASLADGRRVREALLEFFSA